MSKAMFFLNMKMFKNEDEVEKDMGPEMVRTLLL
jgi:hypothetical protein